MSKTDGYLKITTKIDNTGVDKDIADLENKIKKMQTENMNASNEQRNLENEINEYDKLVQKAKEYEQELKNMQGVLNRRDANGKLLPLTSSEIQEVRQLQDEYSRVNIELDRQAPKIEKIHSKLEKIKSKQEENNTKIAQFKQKIESINAKKLETQISNVGRGIQNTIGHIGKMALAVFGVRTAWNAVSRAMSIVSQYNPQIATDIAYIQYALASILLPIIQKLISLTYTLLSYLNAITSAWFGINLFSNSSVKNFQKMQNSAKGTAKSAKEIQKALQGFDEMNVLSDQNSNAGVTDSSGGGANIPSADLNNLLQGDVPGWLQWIIDNKDLILTVMAGITAGLIAWKLGLGGIQALGIGLAVAGLVYTIKSIIDFIKDPSWENFSKILIGISVTLAGIALIVGGSAGVMIAGIAAAILGVALIIQGVIAYLQDPTWENFMTILAGIALIVGVIALLIGGIPALIVAIILAIAAIGLAIYKHWDEIKATLSAVGKWFYDNVIQPIKEFFDGLIKGLKEGWENFWTALQIALSIIAQWVYDNVIKPVIDFFINLKDSIVNIFANIGAWFAKVFNEARDAIKNAFSSIGQFFQNIWNGICNTFRNVGEFFGNAFRSAYNNIKNIFGSIGSFFSGIWSNVIRIFTNIGQKIGDAVGGAFRGAVNAVLRTIENVLNTPIRAVNALIGVINKVPGINLGRINTFSLPRLARGTVLTSPTPVIAGEAGAEAFMPLENHTEWMDYLADKLVSKMGVTNGGYYVINLDGRTVQRGIAKRQNDLAFAKNGGK